MNSEPLRALVLICAALAAACGGEQPAPQSPSSPTPPPAEAPTPTPPPAPTPSTDAAAVDQGGPPVDESGASNDPKDYPGLKIETLRPGDGEELVVGKKARIHYIGTLLNGRQFDSTWQRGTEPAEFSLDGVVPGFRVGLLGMKVGERRRLTIPGEFAYKEAGSPGAGIGPNETLVFDVELVDVVD
ncbi:MAG TPA: FKBP-type peptidyl-prolyl cis-trans isomerase [Planctomycetota bacterium]|nr:FKBP-type peptidyl-prolyl cis-trans isomerase [Planctomycetota bacterium]